MTRLEINKKIAELEKLRDSLPPEPQIVENEIVVCWDGDEMPKDPSVHRYLKFVEGDMVVGPHKVMDIDGRFLTSYEHARRLGLPWVEVPCDKEEEEPFLAGVTLVVFETVDGRIGLGEVRTLHWSRIKRYFVVEGKQ